MEKKKVLVIGSGGREHALVWKLLQSQKVGKIFVAPGNAGTEKIAENIDIKATDCSALIEFATDNKIDLTVVGPDDPLAAGVVDEFQKSDLKVFGPSKKAARIESSKSFSKNLMKKQDIPTAAYEIFSNFDDAVKYLEEKSLPVVIKASGLALGKGVSICHTKNEAIEALKSIMVERTFGDSGSEVVIEEFLGNEQEISIHCITDGKSILLFPTAQDHKPVFDDDKGPNTGGMGTYAPIPWAGQDYLEWAREKVIKPTLLGLKSEDSNFVGCLYPGLKLTKEGPKVLEFNARFGDPETQPYMRLLDSDLYEIFEATLEERLDKVQAKWKDLFAVCVILASEGYPVSSGKPAPITGIDEAEKIPNVVVFHSGTKMVDNGAMATGGRVLGVTSTGKTLQEAVDTAYKAVNKIKFKGMQYRKDIAAKALKGQIPTKVI